MVILHPFTPPTTPAMAAAQQPAWFQWFSLSTSEAEGQSLPPVFHVPTVEDDDYENLIKRFWDNDFIIVEHDVIPTRDQLLDMIRCPYPLCARAVRIWPGKTGLEKPVWSARVVTLDSSTIINGGLESASWRWITEGETQADHTGFSMVKFTRVGVTGVRPFFGKGDWKDLDWRVCKALLDVRSMDPHSMPPWHIHWPEAIHIARWS